MFIRQFADLGLHKSSCMLFSCIFFVSCSTVSKKPTEVTSAGSRNIASAAMASINASAFLVMQDCPVLSSIQSRIQANTSRGGYLTRLGKKIGVTSRTRGTPTSEQITSIMEETDRQGKTLTQRLLLELSSSSDCLSRVDELKQSICVHRTYSDACEALDQLERLESDTIIQEFESFAGASIDSFESSEQLAAKVEEFLSSNNNSLHDAFRDSINKQFHKLYSAYPKLTTALMLVGTVLVAKKALTAVGGFAIVSVVAPYAALALLFIGFIGTSSYFILRD